MALSKGLQLRAGGWDPVVSIAYDCEWTWFLRVMWGPSPHRLSVASTGVCVAFACV